MNEQENNIAPEEQDITDLVEVVGVRFKVGGKVYYFDPIGMPINRGENVIIDTSRGIEYGECAQGNHMVEASRVVQPLRPVVRRANDDDIETLKANYEKERNAFRVAQAKIIEHKLDMKLVGVEYSFDGTKILFFFTSEGRVDFRDLVKNLASIFRARIELRQIGVRDEAKMLGGLGICGRQFCCSSFLDDFHPVSIKMAKTQNLSLNPTKISGTCGRLMCCLKYEQYAYEDMHKRTPKVESLVETDKGQGTVIEANLLKAQVKVRLDNEPEAKIYKVRDITVLRNGGKNKKETPLLPPDPPILEDEPVVEEAPFNFDSYTASSAAAAKGAAVSSGIPEQTEAGRSQNQKRRNKNRSKKPAQQSAATQSQNGGQKPEQKANSKPQKPASEGSSEAQAQKPRRNNRNRNGGNRDQQAKAAPPTPQAGATGEAANTGGTQNPKGNKNPRRNKNRNSQQKPAN